MNDACTGGEMMEILYENDGFSFVLGKEGSAVPSAVKITRIARQGGERVILLDYRWSEQLTVEVEAEQGVLREDGTLCWQLHVTAHHEKGMALGEFTETQWYEAENPFGSAEELVCRTVDIVRKTRFAIEERHLKHLPHQTYPPVDGRQGPYGHPKTKAQRR